MMSCFSPSTLFLFNLKCLGGGADMRPFLLLWGLSCCHSPEEVGAGGGGLAPCSMFLSLDVLSRVGGIDTVLIWIHVFFGESNTETSCSCGFWIFFSPSSFYTCGRTVQRWLNSCSPVSHILSDSSVWRCCLEYCFWLLCSHFRETNEHGCLFVFFEHPELEKFHRLLLGF